MKDALNSQSELNSKRRPRPAFNGVKLSKKEVEHIAHLARIRLTDKEKALYAKQLSSILDYVAQLKSVKTDGVLETAQVTGLENVMREDIIEPCDTKTMKKIIDNFPEKEDDLLKTRSVF